MQQPAGHATQPYRQRAVHALGDAAAQQQLAKQDEQGDRREQEVVERMRHVPCWV
jgi:hypothetical protein